MFGNPGPFSYSPRGFSPEDIPQMRRTFPQDDHRSSPLQRNNTSRPSGKSIYMQRKEYSEELNRKPDNLHVRVEHLFTCELDDQEVKTVEGCVAKLKRLDAKGRIWSQEMILEVQGANLLLCDIETKAELEMLPLSSILQTKAVKDSCAYNSLLTITVQGRNKPFSQVYMFQCEETGAELIKSDLDKVLRGGVDVEPRRETPDIRSNLENLIGQHAPGSFRHTGPAMQRERTPPPLPDHPPPKWSNREPEQVSPPWSYSPREPQIPQTQPDFRDQQLTQEVPFTPELSDEERNTEILNHVITDMEIFMENVKAATTAPVQQENNNKKKMFKKKKPKTNIPRLPSWEEYTSFLQKIKYGFNLLGQLDGTLTSISAAEYVHIFFSSLGMVISHYPADLPPTVLSPLLTVSALRLLSDVVSPEEDALWRSLGDSWNIPRSHWPNDDIPVYIPEFYDGWQPPPPSGVASRPPFRNGPMRNSQHSPPDYRQEEPVSNGPWASTPPPPQHSAEPPLYMRAMYDFMARNNQELSIMKGDVVEVVQKTRQWWVIRNSRGEEGSVPQNILEPMESSEPMEDLQRGTRGAGNLDMTSTPAEVGAWLSYKGFSNITVRSLGVLSGGQLLKMTKDQIRAVCPEEGGRVFFQLQASKSAIALASEPSGRYNSESPGRYNSEPPGRYNGEPPGRYNSEPPGRYNSRY
ncbi:epidermal growth factor receptor kinase substrate 8-like protein 3b isoform X1 [Xyrichtys novacula]|uniref:Epidermal growth factor receptor kinase substrate 8-like protein 3b isoform X1 n=1 Tax=Xyrichtys novacula TaxID=13765 RepID=A0AAV1HIN8_XYRNO|nr:epidermal growth factor receptor kinase substrate 8-like protein 3b isoform X1 [Xyrichtys novacula]